MKKLTIFLTAILCAAFMLTGFAACGGDNPPSETSANGVDFEGEAFVDLAKNDGLQTLNSAVMFDADSYITYNWKDSFTAADGETYKTSTESPMLKPVWKELEKRLNIKFNNNSGNSSNLESQWSAALGAGFAGYDILNASVENINDQGERYKAFVDIKPFLNRMPNLKAFLDSNPFVAKTIVSGSDNMFYAPYFDGYNDIERMFILRADWVRRLLDGASTDGDSASISGLNVYTPFLPESLPAQSVTVTAKSGTATETLNKLATQNIIKRMNGLVNPTGKALLDTFKEYVTDRYGSYYGTKPSDLFVGQNASYDADELVALLRLVKANPKLSSGDSAATSEGIIPFYPRSYTNDRTADVLRLAQIWGVRGLDVANQYFFMDKDGKLQDARTQDDTYYGIQKLNELYKENLILQDFNNKGTLGAYNNLIGAFDDNDWRGYLNTKNAKKQYGFMTYDYNQTTTLLNGLDGNVSAVGPNATGTAVIEGFDLTPVIPPFTVWKGKEYSGSDKTLTLPATLSSDNFYRFTESWRSVKPDGWCISSKLTGKALERALALFDYLYSVEGNKLMSFGPDPWIANSNSDPTGGPASEAKGTITYLGREIPKLATQALTELKLIAKGNYTNYYRRVLGGTMPIGYIKDQGMEYQTTHDKGKAGQDRINNAILTGTLRHALVGSDYTQTSDLSLRAAPTTLPYTRNEQSIVRDNFTQLHAKFSLSNSDSMAGNNLFYKYIMRGFGSAVSGDPENIETRFTRAALADYVTKSGSGNLNCSGFLIVSQNAFSRINF